MHLFVKQCTNEVGRCLQMEQIHANKRGDVSLFREVKEAGEKCALLRLIACLG